MRYSQLNEGIKINTASTSSALSADIKMGFEIEVVDESLLPLFPHPDEENIKDKVLELIPEIIEDSTGEPLPYQGFQTTINSKDVLILVFCDKVNFYIDGEYIKSKFFSLVLRELNPIQIEINYNDEVSFLSGLMDEELYDTSDIHDFEELAKICDLLGFSILRDFYKVVFRLYKFFNKDDMDIDIKSLSQDTIDNILKGFEFKTFDYRGLTKIEPYSFGGEYVQEFHIPNYQDIFKEHGVIFDRIEYDNSAPNSPVELVSYHHNLKDSLDELIDSLEGISELCSQGIVSTSDATGLHVSISKKTDSHFNMLKFVVLMNIPHLTKLFPPRVAVEDLNIIIQRHITEYFNDRLYEHSHDDIVEYAKNNPNHLLKEVFGNINFQRYAKMQSINFGEYDVSDGRIELRYFGGRGYQRRIDEIKREVMRAAYLLDIAHSDKHEDEFKKQLFKMVRNNPSIDEYYKLCICIKNNNGKLLENHNFVSDSVEYHYSNLFGGLL